MISYESRVINKKIIFTMTLKEVLEDIKNCNIKNFTIFFWSCLQFWKEDKMAITMIVKFSQKIIYLLNYTAF